MSRVNELTEFATRFDVLSSFPPQSQESTAMGSPVGDGGRQRLGGGSAVPLPAPALRRNCARCVIAGQRAVVRAPDDVVGGVDGVVVVEIAGQLGDFCHECVVAAGVWSAQAASV